jgi:PAS domain S-box-containing protein
MKGRVSIERIATARQRLAELSEPGNGPPDSVSQVRQAVDLLSSVLDELETVAQDGQLEQEADNESRFNTLAETASDGIISIDDRSTIRYVNPAAGEMFGDEPAEMLDKNLTVLMPERFRESHLTSFRRYLATGQRHIRWRAIELVGLHKSGREFPIEISFGEDVRRDKHFFTGIVRDITDRKRSEEALRVSEQRFRSLEVELAHITRIMTMGEITSSIAHEINQPLGAIVNYGNACLRLITSGSPDLTDIAIALSEIVNDANRASSIIAQIRALSKKALPEMVVLEVKDLVAEILPLVRHELNGRRIVLETALSDNLSPVMGDRIQLQQVLLNLVINGMEAMHQIPEDRRYLSIAAQSQVSEGKAFSLISVTDSGIGLSAEDQPKLFEAFYTTKAEGMGMGLAISRSIVEAHGGRLWAAPNAGPGATFQFVLPAAHFDRNATTPVTDLVH